MDNLSNYWVAVNLSVNKYETLKLKIDSSDSYTSYLLYASHNESHRSFAGFVYGISSESGYGIKYDALISNNSVEILEGTRETRALTIKNNSSSQFRISLIKLTKNNATISTEIIV